MTTNIIEKDLAIIATPQDNKIEDIEDINVERFIKRISLVSPNGATESFEFSTTSIVENKSTDMITKLKTTRADLNQNNNKIIGHRKNQPRFISPDNRKVLNSVTKGLAGLLDSGEFNAELKLQIENAGLKAIPVSMEDAYGGGSTTYDDSVYDIPTDRVIAEMRSFQWAGIRNEIPVVFNRFPIYLPETQDVTLGAVIRTKDAVIGPLGQQFQYYVITSEASDDYFFIAFTNADHETIQNNILGAFAMASNMVYPEMYPKGCFITIISPIPFVQHSFIASAVSSLIGITNRYPITGAWMQGVPYLPNFTDKKTAALTKKGLGLIIVTEFDDIEENPSMLTNFSYAGVGSLLIKGMVLNPIPISEISQLSMMVSIDLPKNVRSQIKPQINSAGIPTTTKHTNTPKMSISNPQQKGISQGQILWEVPFVGSQTSGTMKRNDILNYEQLNFIDPIIKAEFKRLFEFVRDAPTTQEQGPEAYHGMKIAEINAVYKKLANLIVQDESRRKARKTGVSNSVPNPLYQGMSPNEKTRARQKAKKNQKAGTLMHPQQSVSNKNVTSAKRRKDVELNEGEELFDYTANKVSFSDEKL